MISEEKRIEIRFLRSQGFAMSAIGAKFGISRQRVNQILAPEKHDARMLIRRKLAIGEIVRPSNCEGCGDIWAELEAHHEDYSKPLDVKWLCLECHKLADLAKGRFKSKESQPRKQDGTFATIPCPA